ncbi:MAG: hypothetical protein QM752_02175 [Gammaproteobacteria bacterium]
MQTYQLPLIAYRIAPDGDLVDPNHLWKELYEVTESGAVLVRPDGHVVWRSRSMVDNPKAELKRCLLANGWGE